MKNKIIILISILALFIIAGLYLFRPQEEVIIPQKDVSEESLNNFTPEFYRKRFGSQVPPNFDKAALSDSRHGGVATFVSNYRIELSAYKVKNKFSVLVLHLENSKAYAVSPRNSQFFVKIGDKNIELMTASNGLYANQSEILSLPQKITIFGKIRGDAFKTEVELKEYISGIEKLPFFKNQKK